jgi:hypothetical protein
MTTGRKLATWRITIIRKKGEYLSTVEAIKVPIREFGITDPERLRRLIAQRIEA